MPIRPMKLRRCVKKSSMPAPSLISQSKGLTRWRGSVILLGCFDALEQFFLARVEREARRALLVPGIPEHLGADVVEADRRWTGPNYDRTLVLQAGQLAA